MAAPAWMVGFQSKSKNEIGSLELGDNNTRIRVLCTILRSSSVTMGLRQSTTQTANLSTLDTNTEEVKFILEHVQNNCVTIFSKSYCSYCTSTKKLFNDLEIPYKVIELNKMKSGDKIQTVLAEMTDGTTVPRVFVNGECVGGATDTKSLHQKGILLKLIQRCKR